MLICSAATRKGISYPEGVFLMREYAGKGVFKACLIGKS
jgi:hypothetical protein